MGKIISLHSFRRGTGKTNILASIAAVMVSRGLRVAMIDADLQSPSLFVLLGLNTDDIGLFLNDYLMGRCEIQETALDLTARFDHAGQGALYFVPSNPSAVAIMTLIEEGFDPERLSAAYNALVQQLELDVLLIDTQAGINEYGMTAIANADQAIITMKLDEQNYQGTAVMIELGKRLGANIALLVNDMHPDYDREQIKAQSETAYEVPVLDVLLHSEDVMMLASSDVFAQVYPDHPIAIQLERLADQLAP